MSKIATILVGVAGSLFLVSPMQAAAVYSFDDDTPAVPAFAHPLWAPMVRRHDAEQASIDACLADGASCPAHLRHYRNLMHRARHLAPREQLALVDRFFDERERAVTGNDRSQWQTLSEVLRAGGDGADIAVAKYFALRQLGFGSEALRVVVSYDAHTHTDKAVLAVLVEGNAHELTARRKRGRAPTRRDLAVAYAVNENFWWDHTLFGGSRRDSRSL